MTFTRLIRATFGYAVVICSVLPHLYGREPEIIIYGQNAPEWNKTLGATATRGSCSSEPAVCVNNAKLLMAGQHTRHFYLNLPNDPDKAPSYALHYSEASLKEPRIYEVALDDFADAFQVWCKTPSLNCSQLLSRIIDNVKSENTKLKFGITVYEDDLPALLENARLPASLRSRINLVHLYIHNRENGPNFESYLDQVKKAFPSAGVIAGTYAYDRLDYEHCRKCSPGEQRDLQKETLRIQVRLLNRGRLTGIEFYPGHFGWEEKWSEWNDPHTCSPSRKVQCIEQTKAMHNDAAVILRGIKK